MIEEGTKAGSAGSPQARAKAKPPLRRQGTKGSVAKVAVALLLLSTRAFATPTNEEIVKSFNDSMNQSTDFSVLIPWFFAACGAIAVVIYFRTRQKRQAIPRALNHPKKLVKEIVRSVEIDPAEMKRVTQLARELDCDSPLTLLLCPSLVNPGDRDHPPAQ